MRTRTRKSATERRREIAAATLRIIGQRGVTALTMATLAEEVGLTSGALFRHFASRDEILVEAVRFAVEQIEQTFPARDLAPLARLIALATNRVTLVGSDPGLAWLLRSEQVYLTVPEDAVKQLRDLVSRSRQFILDAIREGAAAGSIRADIEPETLIVPVMGTIHALIGMPGVHQETAWRRRSDADRVIAALMRMLAPPGTGSVTDEVPENASSEKAPGRA